MFRTIFAGLYMLLTFIGTYFGLMKVRRLPDTISEQERNEKVYQTPHKFSIGMLKITGSTVKVEGLENIPQDKAVLFVGNHQSYFDIPVLLGYLNKPIGFIAKVETKKIPIAAGWMEQMQSVFMDRGDRRKSLQAIKDGIEILKNGQSLVIFPEGTRSKSDDMAEFKPGSITLATKSGAPIIPVSISGTHRIYESNNNRIQPSQVTLVVGKPIYPEDVKDLNSQELTKIVEERVREKLV